MSEDPYEACPVGKKVLKKLADRLTDDDFHELAPHIEELCDPDGDWVDATDNLKDLSSYDEFVHTYSEATDKPEDKVRDNFDHMESIVTKRDRKKMLPFLR